MKNIYLTLSLFLISTFGFSQVVNNGALLHIGNNAKFRVEGTYLQVTNNGTISNNGDLYVADSIVILSNGTLINTDSIITIGNIRNSGGTFQGNTSGTIVLAKTSGSQNIKLDGNGNSQQVYNLAIIGGGVKNIINDVVVQNTLNLSNGIVSTENFNGLLGIDTGATIINASSSSFVHGGLHKRYIKTAPSSFTYPVGHGFTANDYRPITFNNVPPSTLTENLILGTMVVDPATSTGAFVDPNYRDFQAGLSLDNKYWFYDIMEGNFRGATVTVSYGTGDNVVGNQSVVAVSNASNSAYRSLGNGANTGSTVTSAYRVDDTHKYIAIGQSTNVKYRISALLYGAVYRYRGNRQNYYTNVTLNPIFGPSGSNPQKILPTYAIDSLPSSPAGYPVDVVTVYLRTTGSYAYVDTVKAWIMSDGSLRDFNSITLDYVTFPKATVGQSYHVEIRHKNHLPIMSSAAFNASAAIPGSTIDLTNIANIYGAGAQLINETGHPFNNKAAMWAGDARNDWEVNASDYYDVLNANNVFLPGYTQTDVVINNTEEFTNADDVEVTSIANDNLYYSLIP
jgi:hypothetical protein